MNIRFIGPIAIVAVATSLTLGALDSEVHSIGDLLTPGNLPALLIFAAMAFTMILVVALGVAGTLQAIRTRRTR